MGILKVVMTIKEFSTFVMEGIYSLRFAAILLTFIILLLIIIQICEVLYSFVRLMQPNLENNKYSLTEVITESRSNSGKTSLRKERTSQEDSSISKETAEKIYHKPMFAEKSLEARKSSSTSTSRIPSNSSKCLGEHLEENFFKRKDLTRKEQSTNQLTIATSKGSNGSLKSAINSPSEESHTQIATDSTLSSRKE
ncbi:unnamed protein product [Litomosoides sigmodontis]|uniref:Uncharacterized protein n=1 Tax=Litomosoides sigmodontis TaxID=42156 RepID=A0A3P6TFK6_LITSI|nr:unnamed protein product [Litomosoides sigmodontis]